jgi:hypothetical protein
MKYSLYGGNDEWLDEESKKKYEVIYRKNIKIWLDGSKKGRESFKCYEKKEKSK